MSLKYLLTITAAIISFEASAIMNIPINPNVVLRIHMNRAMADCNRLDDLIRSEADTNDLFNSERNSSLPDAARLAPVIADLRNRIKNQETSAQTRAACAEKAMAVHMETVQHNSDEAEAVLKDNTSDNTSAPATEVHSESACNINVDGEDCGIPENSATAQARDIVQLIPKVARFSTEDCQCAKQKFRKQYGLLGGRRDKRELTGKLNDFIIKSYGKKFINKYASNIEDLNFFLGEKASVFKTAGSNENSGTQYQCNKYSGYEEKMKAACRRNRVPPEEGSRRIGQMLSAWGRPEYSNFNDHLKNVAEDVLKIRPTAGSNTENKPYKRETYDAFRYTQVQNNSDIIFVDRMMANILQGPLREKFLSTLAGKSNAEEAFIEILVDESIKPDSVVANILKDQSFESTPFAARFKPLIAEGDKLKLKNSLSSSFRTTAANHPGLKYFLSDKAGIADLALVPNTTSIHKFLEGQNAGGYIDNKFRAKCEEMQNEMAEMACTRPQDILSKISASDLEKMLHHEPALRNERNVLNILLCEETGRTNAPLLKNLDMEHGLPASEQSDYLSRLLNPANPRDRFSVMAKENEKPNSVIASFANTQADTRMGSGGSGGSSDRVSYSGSDRVGVENTNSAVTQNSSSTAQTVAQRNAVTDAAVSESVDTRTRVNADINNAAVDVPGQNLYSNNVVAPNAETQSQANQTSEDGRRNARSELRDAIANEENKAEVDRLLSNVDDPTTIELARLRQESLKSRQEFLELSSKAEQAKLKALEERMKELQDEKASAVSNSDETEINNETGNRRRKSGERSIASSDVEFDSLPGSQNSPTAGVNSGNAGGSSSGAAVSSRGSVGGASGLSSNAIGPGFNSGGALVISGNAVSQSQEVRTQEINNELLKYLNQSEPDISTLMNIKTSGMVYKFKVMKDGQLVDQEVALNYSDLSDDLKKLIDQKIALKKGSRSIASIDQELAQVRRVHSYTALRLIINQQAKK